MGSHDRNRVLQTKTRIVHLYGAWISKLLFQIISDMYEDSAKFILAPDDNATDFKGLYELEGQTCFRYFLHQKRGDCQKKRFRIRDQPE